MRQYIGVLLLCMVLGCSTPTRCEKGYEAGYRNGRHDGVVELCKALQDVGFSHECSEYLQQEYWLKINGKENNKPAMAKE